MLSFAETLSDRERRHFRSIAIFAAVFGGFATQIIENNSPVVLFLGMLNASDSLAIFSTSLNGIASILLLIPGAALCARWGLRRTYTISSIGGSTAFLAIALAPYFGAAAPYTVIGGTFVIGLSQTIYLATWYPLLDNILKADERSRFFASMRFVYMIFMALVLYALGKFLQSTPEMWLLQTLFLAAAIALWGRKFFMDRIPVSPDMRRESPDIRRSLDQCLRNRPLLGFSLYICFFYIIYASVMPLALIYMKSYLGIAAGTIMILTSVNMVGKITGFFLIGRFAGFLNTRRMIIGTHFLTLITILILMAALPSMKGYLPLIFGIAFFLLGIIYSSIGCISSVEMLALAPAGSKIITMSFCMTAVAIGTAGGTLLSTGLIGCGALAETWYFMGLAVSKFQFIFAAGAAGMCYMLLLLPLVPAIIGRHNDYYRP